MTLFQFSRSLSDAHEILIYSFLGTKSALAEKKLWSAIRYIHAQLDEVIAQILDEREGEEVAQ